jgi:acetylornithine deacetylase/succinyl-diaminopimelate desuccinylase-like protein
MPVTVTIPVLELTQNGYDKVLDLVGETENSLAGSPPAVPFDAQAHLWISLDDVRSVEAVNVLGLLSGSDPALADEVILFSTHYDHVGDDPGTWVCPEGVSAIDEPRDPGCEREPGRRYPGANDNASGVGVMLEILRLWNHSGYRPRKSVLFAAWGAQEAGQAGMSYYMGHPLVPLERTVAVIHMDAVGGGEGYYLGAQGTRTGEAYLRSTIQCAEDLLDGRLSMASPPRTDDPARLYREADIPTLWLTWRGASEENWPAEHADLVEPYRLGVTGRMVTLALMALAQ